MPDRAEEMIFIPLEFAMEAEGERYCQEVKDDVRVKPNVPAGYRSRLTVGGSFGRADRFGGRSYRACLSSGTSMNFP